MDRREAIKRTSLFLGYAVSASAITALMNGCKADPNAPATSDWQPEFFTKEEGAFIMEVAETILPKTDTPGAKDAGVHSYLDRYIKIGTSEEEQQFIRMSLTSMQEECKKQMGKDFLACSAEERQSYLEQIEKTAYNNKRQSSEGPPSFWFLLKEGVVLGYMTSEVGGKQFLAYDAIPGEYNACIPYKEGTPAWTF